MVQTVRSVSVRSGHKLLIIEKPFVLSRIFFSICTFAPQTSWYESQISFGDPDFYSYYILGGLVNHFEARSDEIFQGDIWVRNVSGIDLLYSATEILI